MTNPIQKALAQASTIQGANRAMEHNSNPRVRVIDRQGLYEDAVRQVSYEPDLAARMRYVDSVTALYDRAVQRGDGVAIYENHDLGHPEVGERQYVSYGGPDCQLETREQQHVSLATSWFSYNDDVVPLRLPDIGGRINWRYLLVAVVPA